MILTCSAGRLLVAIPPDGSRSMTGGRSGDHAASVPGRSASA